MRVKRYVLILGAAILLLASCAPQGQIPRSISLRGAWVQAQSVLTEEDIEAIVEKAERGGFKQIFVGVFENGTTIYPSAVATQDGEVEIGFDPLAYIVQKAHEKGIQVHAWFEVGRVANGKGESAVIDAHPDWGLVGPEGQTMPWLNFTHPAARAFISDMVMEAVARGVDGIHFDYTRYPDSTWGFDEYSITAFNREHDFDLNELRYSALPVYGHFEGNALLQPVTAEVLARFSNGIPAVLLNQYGNGNALILNWNAAERTTAVGTEILNRAIEAFLGQGSQVSILRSETTIAEYGSDSFDATIDWVDSLGLNWAEVSSADVAGLDLTSVLLLPNVYLFSEAEAAQLAAFVSNGGSAIFIDGPTPSMELSDIRAVTGMLPLRNHFEARLQMTASVDHPLLPVSGRSEDIDTARTRNKQWFTFREAGINSLLSDVYEQVKAQHPDVLVSVTITSDQTQAQSDSLQNWQTWLDEGYIDILIPRAYEDTPKQVRATLKDWSSAARKYRRLTYGLIVYVENDGEAVSKSPEQLLEEINVVADSESNGYMIFDLDRLNAAQLNILANVEP